MGRGGGEEYGRGRDGELWHGEGKEGVKGKEINMHIVSWNNCVPLLLPPSLTITVVQFIPLSLQLLGLRSRWQTDR